MIQFNRREINHPTRLLFCRILAVQAGVVSLKETRRLKGLGQKTAGGGIVCTSSAPTHVSPDQLVAAGDEDRS